MPNIFRHSPITEPYFSFGERHLPFAAQPCPVHVFKTLKVEYRQPHNSSHVKQEERADDSHSNSPASSKSIKQENLLKCELCSTVCSSISQLQSHTLSEHVPEKKPSISTSNSAPSTKRVACQQCEDTFEDFAQFAIHMKSHLSSVTSQLFFCPICPVGTPFRDKKSQLEHLTTQHLQIQVTQHICSICDSAFPSPQAQSVHFAEAHKKYSCTNCDFETENEKTFKEHSKQHSRQLIMYGCALCATSYPSQLHLITHVQMSHDQETFYPPSLPIPTPPSPKSTPKQRVLQCSVCDESVLGEDGLDEHRLRKHCKVRFADKCADCQEPLLNETSFVEHCLRHSKDHAHHCPLRLSDLWREA
eukprot:NP_497233.2 Putative zinc finger protein C09F5.3 [Caenorhabditis elegans]